MVDVYNFQHSSVLGVERVPEDEVSSYGVVSGDVLKGGLLEVSGIVEKPPVEEAPSNLAVVGRYILTPKIFDLLETTPRGAGGEIQLTDAIDALLSEQRVLAYEFEGKRFDCGNKLGYLQAQVEFGLDHHEIGGAFEEYLRNLDPSTIRKPD